MYGNAATYGGCGTPVPAATAIYSPLRNGARDGYEKGREDAAQQRSFDPLRHTWYRVGDRHYEDRYGSREHYKDIYRRGTVPAGIPRRGYRAILAMRTAYCGC